jgi:uncharacterized protein YbbC (DUF1343 family)
MVTQDAITKTGLDVLVQSAPEAFKGVRVGLLCNHGSVGRNLEHSRFLLRDRAGLALSCLFSPQHGFSAEKQDNMIESDHGIDRATGLPLFSLYGESRRPSREMFDHLDVLLVDLVDVGTRVYTFIYTMAYCLEAAARWHKKVVVLDRPNPIGGLAVEGNVLDPAYRSFVGLFELPMRHAMTIGELALFFNREGDIGAELEIVKMENWQRSMYFDETGLPWVFPSPNMPTPQTALVYPGQVVWEGTSVSEGRGTTLPFELVGAPYWETERLSEVLTGYDLPGCLLRPVVFEPTSGKWAGQPCNGYQLHVTDRQQFLPYRTALSLLQAVMQLYRAEFAYKEPPYEYEFEKLPMDLILGDQRVREELENGMKPQNLEKRWQPGLQQFIEKRSRYLLY